MVEHNAEHGANDRHSHHVACQTADVCWCQRFRYHRIAKAHDLEVMLHRDDVAVIIQFRHLVQARDAVATPRFVVRILRDVANDPLR